MSSVLTIDGKNYIPAADAAARFGYTKDYLLVLAKSKKIDGKKIENRWYIEPSSAEEFFNESKLRKEAWKKQVSEERKLELKSHTGNPNKPHHRVALIETFVIVIIGLSLGVAGYLGTSRQAASVGEEYGFFESLARSLYAFITPGNSTTQVEHSGSSMPEETSEMPMESSAIAARIGTTTYTSIVVAPEEVMTAQTVEAIQESFSDEVEVAVDPKNPNTGVITPIFRDHEGETYRFLMVPVNTTTTSP